MKKKGLIISTIVMVVVLIASLTTATYAWFTTDSKATISQISINTASASDVQIGLRQDGYSSSIWNTAPNASQFKNGSVGFNNLAVTGGTAALGSSITSALSLAGLTKAIGTASRTGSEGSYVYSVDASFDGSHYIIAANGTGTTADVSTVDLAHANMYTKDSSSVQGDYVDWVIGFMPTINNVDTFTFNITVNPGEKPTLGLLAALHLRYSWDGTHYYDVDLYGTNNDQTQMRTAVATPTGQGGPAASETFTDVNSTTDPKGSIALAATTKVSQSATTLGTKEGTAGMIAGINDSTDLNAGALNYAITVGTVGTALAQNKINQMHFQLFYAGYDVDCVNDGLGADATIYFTISNTTFTPAP